MNLGDDGKKDKEADAVGSEPKTAGPNPFSPSDYGPEDPVSFGAPLPRHVPSRKSPVREERASNGQEQGAESAGDVLSDNPFNGIWEQDGPEVVVMVIRQVPSSRGGKPDVPAVAASRRADIGDNPLNAFAGPADASQGIDGFRTWHPKARARRPKPSRKKERQASEGELALVVFEPQAERACADNPMNAAYGRHAPAEVLENGQVNGQGTAREPVRVELDPAEAFVSALAELDMSRRSAHGAKSSKLSTVSQAGDLRNHSGKYVKPIDKALLDRLTSYDVAWAAPASVNGPLPSERGTAFLEEKMAMLGYSVKRTAREKAAPFIFALIVGTIGFGGMFTSGMLMERFLAVSPADALVAEKAPVYGSTFGHPVKVYTDADGVEHTEYQMKGVLAASGVEDSELPFIVKVTALSPANDKDVSYYEMTPMVESEIGSYEKGTQLTVEIIAAPVLSDGTVYGLGAPVSAIADSTAMQDDITLVSAVATGDKEVKAAVETSARNYKKLGYDEAQVDGLCDPVLDKMASSSSSAKSKIKVAGSSK